ncbi:hypothetical protein M2E35_28245, partial [Klebsiella pneumoniae]|nr:hypothetical protein [Klebsiella pneumoniae]MDZ3501727.1 hypothetical protein [Klebsiella pneumoniae]MDZ3561440.1 hypothetical protein [Klebsiella pneumoniae]MDZ3567025.1 hypothetical protein [Klebsiella pneumoniae]MDZ3584060.1 hypothetical protein [Klebsiella pneumoniae]
LLCHGTVCVVGKIRDLILQLSKSSIYSTKPDNTYYLYSLELVLSLVTIILFTFCGKQKIINK